MIDDKKNINSEDKAKVENEVKKQTQSYSQPQPQTSLAAFLYSYFKKELAGNLSDS